MEHKKVIEKYDGSLLELSEDIGDLDYDAMVEHFTNLSRKYRKDAIHDLELKHQKVAEHLKNISQSLQEILKNDMQPLAELCRKYNQKETK